MPSLHVGWALWCGFLLYHYSSHRWARWAGVAYPLVTTVVVLSTGNHYLLDAVAGAIVMAMGGIASSTLGRLGRLVRRRRADSSGAGSPADASTAAGPGRASGSDRSTTDRSTTDRSAADPAGESIFRVLSSPTRQDESTGPQPDPGAHAARARSCSSR